MTSSFTRERERIEEWIKDYETKRDQLRDLAAKCLGWASNIEGYAVHEDMRDYDEALDHLADIARRVGIAPSIAEDFLMSEVGFRAHQAELGGLSP